jgi:hypothetical protein
MRPAVPNVTHEGFAQNSGIIPGLLATGEDPARMPTRDDPSRSDDHFDELKYQFLRDAIGIVRRTAHLTSDHRQR